MVSDKKEHGSLRDYWLCLKTNKYFRILWLAEVIDSVGSWLNFISVLTLVEKFSGNSSLAVSAVVLIRFLPSLVLAPLCGVVADRCNRVRVLLVTALVDAAVVAALALVQRPSQAWLLYVLLAAQFTAISFYEPARRAMVPCVVPPRQLHLATTIDSWAWSITGAVGASVGGVLASRLGNATCFLLDSITYLVAAWCAFLLPRHLGNPGAAPSLDAAEGAGAESQQLLKKRQSDVAGLSLEMTQMDMDLDDEQAGDLGDGSSGVKHRQKGEAGPAHPSRAERRHAAAAAATAAAPNQAGAAGSQLGQSPAGKERARPRPPSGTQQPKLKHSDAAEVGQPAGSSEATHIRSGGSGGGFGFSQGLSTAATLPAADFLIEEPALGPPSGAGMLHAAAAAVHEGFVAAREGWSYVCCRENRDVAAMVTIKCCGSLVWGAIDVINVRFSQMPSMQKWGDASETLGFIFAVVGFGCFMGPITLNALIPPHPKPLAWGVAASFGFLFAGFLMMLAAPNILLLLLSTFVRSIGSATLWIYSTLLLQLRVPNALLGRMSAVEMALFTITEAGSSVFGGAAFDVLHLSLQQTLLILTLVAGLDLALWVAFATAYSKWGPSAAAAEGPSRMQGGKEYAAVATDEAEDLERA